MSSVRFGELIPAKDRDVASKRRTTSHETSERRADALDRREDRAPRADQAADREQSWATNRRSERNEAPPLKSDRSGAEAERLDHSAEQKPGSLVESDDPEAVPTDEELELTALAEQDEVVTAEEAEQDGSAAQDDPIDSVPALPKSTPDSDTIEAMWPLIPAGAAPKAVVDQPVTAGVVTAASPQAEQSVPQGSQPVGTSAVAVTAGIEAIKGASIVIGSRPNAVQSQIASPVQSVIDPKERAQPGSVGVTKTLSMPAEAAGAHLNSAVGAPVKDPSAAMLVAVPDRRVRPTGSREEAKTDALIESVAALGVNGAEAAEANPSFVAQPALARPSSPQMAAMAELRSAEFAPPGMTLPVSGQSSTPIPTPGALADVPASVSGFSGTSGEAKVAEASQQPANTGIDLPKPPMPKLAFAEWIQDFDAAHGATHRSGDLVGSLDRAVNGLATPHAGQDALRPTPLQMLPIEVGMQALRGVTKFQIRLDPAELGRVDVKLEFREDGEVKANLVVDRVETLAMLKRDAHTLQQAFEQAGLRQSPDGLSFSLRGENQNQQNAQRQTDNSREPSWKDDGTATKELPLELAMRRVMIPNSSLDLII